MARDAELRAVITAKDDASKTIAKVATAADKLEKPVEVEVDADVSAALGAFDQIVAEAREVQAAADALATALGPELTAKADPVRLVSQLKDMGLTLDQIKGNADQLGGKLRELSDTDVGGKLGGALGTTRGQLDELNKSADSSKNVLANMVGNSVQDIGQLGGVAGSSGVLIGQMAEYMSDAAFQGEKFGSVLKNFAGIAAPALIIAGAVQVVSSMISDSAAESEAAAKRIDTYGEAMRGAANDAAGLGEALASNSGDLRKFDADARTALGGFVEGVADAAARIPILGGVIGDAGQNVTDIVRALNAAGISMSAINSLTGRSAGEASAIVEAWADIAQTSGDINSDQAAGIKQWASTYFTELGKAREQLKLFQVDQEGANAVLDDLAAKADPLSRFAESWATLFADMADGAIDTQAAADAINQLADGLGMTQTEVIELARQHLDDKMKDDQQAIEDTKDELVEFTEKLAEHAVAVGKAANELHDLDSAFAQIGLRRDALAGIFELDTGPRDARSALRDIGLGIDELSEKAKGVKVGDALANNLNADGFLDAIDALAPQIQDAVSTAFGSGGPEAATAMANQYIDQVTKELGGKFTREQVAAMLGLDNITATIQAAVDQASLETAKRQLAILTGVSGETPYTASIALALDAGTITAEQAQVLIQAQLGQAGVAIPSTLAVPQSADAIAEAQAALNSGTPVELPTTVDTTGAQAGVDSFVSTTQPEATVPVTADVKSAETDVSTFTDTSRTTKPIGVDIDAALATAALLKLITLPRTALINIATNGFPAVSDAFNLATQARTATITAQAANVGAVDRELDGLAGTRVATISVRTIEDSASRWWRLNGRFG